MAIRDEVLVAAKDVFLRSYLDEFDRFLPKMMEAAFKKSESCTSLSQQSHYRTLRRLLHDRSIELRQNLNISMDKLLQRSLQTAYSAFRPAFALTGQQAALSLIDTSAFEGELRLAAFTERFRNEAEDQLRDLNVRIALLFGQDEVKEREVPFRPYLVSKSLAEAADGMRLQAELTDIMTPLLAESYAGAIDGIYAAVNCCLAENGIAADMPLRIKKSPNKHIADDRFYRNISGTSDVGATDAAPANFGDGFWPVGANSMSAGGTSSPLNANGIAPAVADDRSRTALDRLFEMVKSYSGAMLDFAEGSESVSIGSAVRRQADSASSYPLQRTVARDDPAAANLPDWLGAAQQAGIAIRHFLERGSQTVGPGAVTQSLAQTVNEQLQKSVGAAIEKSSDCSVVPNVIFDQRRQLCEQTEDTNERMIIDIVAMLFEFIVRDRLLPMEVRAQLGKLQFLVLKIALHDDSFWLGNEHPARALINRIASISAGIGPGDLANVRINAKIAGITEVLLNAALEDVEMLSSLFARVLGELDAFIEQAPRDDKLNRAVLAFGNIRPRSEHFAAMYVQMKEILSSMVLDDFLHEFLAEVWVEVIELADNLELARAERFRILVPDLIWSVAPKIDEYDRQTLSALLPAMIGTLREGMISIAWSPFRQKELLGRLFDAHTGALRSIPQSSPVPSLASLHQVFERLIHHEPHTLQMVGQTLDYAEKILMCGALRRLDADIQSLGDYPEWEEIAVGSGTRYGEKRHYAENREQHLHSGIFIEIKLDRTADRARLSWVSSDASIMLIKLDRQAAPLMIAQAEFRRMAASGQIRFAEERLLFDRAVQSLLHTAEHLDRVRQIRVH